MTGLFVTRYCRNFIKPYYAAKENNMDNEYGCTAFFITAVVIETESVKRLYEPWKRIHVKGDNLLYKTSSLVFDKEEQGRCRSSADNCILQEFPY